MRRMAFAVLAALSLAAAAPGDRGGHADPGVVIGAEVALNQAAHNEGRWAAWREAASDQAVLFVPGRVLAREWLKGRKGAPQAETRQPFEVWTSCDGSYAVTRGGWQAAGAGAQPSGTFVTVWQRQPKAGDYRWLLTLKQTSATPPVAPEMIAGRVASCRARPGGPVADPAILGRDGRPGKAKPRLLQPAIDAANGRSDDGTLRWTATLDAAGAGRFVAARWDGAAYVEAIAVAVDASL